MEKIVRSSIKINHTIGGNMNDNDDTTFISVVQKNLGIAKGVEYKPYRFLSFIGDLVDSNGALITSFISKERATLFINLYNDQMRLNRLLFAGYLNLTLRLSKREKGVSHAK